MVSGANSKLIDSAADLEALEQLFEPRYSLSSSSQLAQSIQDLLPKKEEKVDDENDFMSMVQSLLVNHEPQLHEASQVVEKVEKYSKTPASLLDSIQELFSRQKPVTHVEKGEPLGSYLFVPKKPVLLAPLKTYKKEKSIVYNPPDILPEIENKVGHYHHQLAQLSQNPYGLSSKPAVDPNLHLLSQLLTRPSHDGSHVPLKVEYDPKPELVRPVGHSDVHLYPKIKKPVKVIYEDPNAHNKHEGYSLEEILEQLRELKYAKQAEKLAPAPILKYAPDIAPVPMHPGDYQHGVIDNHGHGIPHLPLKYDNPHHAFKYGQPLHPLKYEQPHLLLKYEQPHHPLKYEQPYHPLKYEQPHHPLKYEQPHHPLKYEHPHPPHAQLPAYGKPGIYGGLAYPPPSALLEKPHGGHVGSLKHLAKPEITQALHQHLHHPIHPGPVTFSGPHISPMLKHGFELLNKLPFGLFGQNFSPAAKHPSGHKKPLIPPYPSQYLDNEKYNNLHEVSLIKETLDLQDQLKQVRPGKPGKYLEPQPLPHISSPYDLKVLGHGAPHSPVVDSFLHSQKPRPTIHPQKSPFNIPVLQFNKFPVVKTYHRHHHHKIIPVPIELPPPVQHEHFPENEHILANEPVVENVQRPVQPPPKGLEVNFNFGRPRQPYDNYRLYENVPLSNEEESYHGHDEIYKKSDDWAEESAGSEEDKETSDSKQNE